MSTLTAFIPKERYHHVLTVTGETSITNGILELNHASTVITTTLPAPQVGDQLTIIDTSASGTAAHVVSAGSGRTFNVTGNNTATLNAPGEALHLIALSSTRWEIIANVGSVALSTV